MSMSLDTCSLARTLTPELRLGSGKRNEGSECEERSRVLHVCSTVTVGRPDVVEVEVDVTPAFIRLTSTVHIIKREKYPRRTIPVTGSVPIFSAKRCYIHDGSRFYMSSGGACASVRT